MNSNFVLLHLSLIPGIGPATIAKILEVEIADISDLYLFSAHDMMHRFGIKKEMAQMLVDGLKDTTMLEQEVALFAQHTISWTTLFSDDYPTLLRTIYAPPPVLTWRGAPIDDAQLLCALVGSRAAGRYAEEMARRLIPGLVEEGCGIVSGGAIGADTMVHKAALDAGGNTIAIIGSGLRYPYPRINSRLFDAMIERGGTVMSSFPMLMQGLPANFPARNRIIAGLSKGCVVLQAAEKSGARITARFALDQGREVFAVPGAVDDPLSAGCHGLIREGAALITSSDDILIEIKKDFVPRAQRTPVKLSSEKGLSPSAKMKENLAGMAPDAQRIWQLCRPQARMTDELLQETGMELTILSQILFDLQLEGRIEQQASGGWEAL